MSIQKPKKAVELRYHKAEGLFAKGHHIVRITDYKETDPTTAEDGTPIASKILLTLTDRKDGRSVIDQLSNGRKRLFLRQMNDQFGGEMQGWGIDEVIAYGMENDIEVWIDWSPAYSEQVMYSKPFQPAAVDPDTIRGGDTKRPTERKATK